MKLGVLFSGGKDSTLAMSKALVNHEIVCLISLISKNPESYMFHVPNISLVDLQADAMELPLIKKETEGVKEEELVQLKEAILKAKEKYGIEGIATGAVRSIYQCSRVQKICHELGLWCFNPLWLKDQMELLEETKKFNVIISGVFAYKIGKEFLGKQIDDTIITKLEKLQQELGINPAGEGGEIETTVLDAPFFRKKIKINDFEIDFKDNCGNYIIKKAELVAK
ncbi:diphthine--ammonia ligase [Candidatus Woesearchaeota archaeon]|nr:diphthine--ammonia ligase [Candidatus Woesearchaeota archaeon]